MENKEWLNDLKVGDKVFVVTEHCYNNIIQQQLRTIKKITPKSRWIVVDNLTFINGSVKTDIWDTTRIYLEQVTKENLKEYQQNKFKRYVLNKIKLLKDKEDITFEQAQQLNEILNFEVKYESIEY